MDRVGKNGTSPSLLASSSASASSSETGSSSASSGASQSVSVGTQQATILSLLRQITPTPATQGRSPQPPAHPGVVSAPLSVVVSSTPAPISLTASVPATAALTPSQSSASLSPTAVSGNEEQKDAAHPTSNDQPSMPRLSMLQIPLFEPDSVLQEHVKKLTLAERKIFFSLGYDGGHPALQSLRPPIAPPSSASAMNGLEDFDLDSSHEKEP